MNEFYVVTKEKEILGVYEDEAKALEKMRMAIGGIPVPGGTFYPKYDNIKMQKMNRKEIQKLRRS